MMNGTTHAIGMADTSPNKVVRAAYTALRGIARIFLPHLPAATLVELLHHAVVSVAEQQIRQEDPEADLSLSRVALKSGLDTRIIKRVRQETPRVSELDICSEAAILAHWVRDPFLRDRVTGKPLELSLYGNKGSFQALVNCHCGRGISPIMVAERLERAGNVTIRDRNWVRLIHADWRWIEEDEGMLLENAGNVINSITSTLVHNYKNRNSNSGKRVERRVFSQPIPESVACSAAKEINQILLVQKDKLHQIVAKYEKLGEENAEHSEKLKVIGAGYYLFEEKEDE